jgi:hypothetical protein
VRLLVGKGILLVPFALTFIGQNVLAARVASRLSEVAQTVASPFVSYVVARDGFDPFAFAPKAAQSNSSAGGPDRDELDADVGVGLDSASANALDARTAPAKRGKHRGSRGSHGAGEKAGRSPPSIRVSEAVVLRLANAGRKPTGRPVPAEGMRPAGIQVFGAAALGLGVRDGDVLTHVSEVPVTSVGQVVALVIAARGARQKSIVGRLWRGEKSYVIVVEQPYPEAGPRPKAEGCYSAADARLDGATIERCRERYGEGGAND